MESLYWETETFSDLDGSWSPGSSSSPYSDQENFQTLTQQDQQQQPHHDSLSYYAPALHNPDLLDTTASSSGSIVAHAYNAAFNEQVGSGSGVAQQQQQQQQQQSQQLSQSETKSLALGLSHQRQSGSSTSNSNNHSHNNKNANSTPSSHYHKKVKNPSKKVHQRNAANMRERRRMKTINDAFEGLRERIPLVSGDRKLSKVDTLRLAIRYIHQLTDMINTTGTASSGQGRNPEAAKVIIRYHNTGFQDPYSDGLYHGQEQFPLYGHSLSWQGHKPMGMCAENKMAAKVWMPQHASTQDIEEMRNYVS